MKDLKEEKIKKEKKLKEKNLEEKDMDKEEQEEEIKIDENKRRKIYITIGSVGAICIGIYLGGSLYFKDRFIIGSEINSISVSSDTIDQAKDKIINQLGEYELRIIGRTGEESIDANEIKLNFDGEEKLNEILKNQNQFAWIGHILDPTKEVLDNFVTYDKAALMKKIDSLNYFKKENEKEPKNASFKYENGEMKIVPEEVGNKLDKKKVIKEIENAIIKGEKSINLEEKECYIKPKYLSDSKKTIETKEKLDKMLKTSIKYRLDDKSVEMSKDDIAKAIKVDKEMNPSVKLEEVNKFVETIAKKFNTIGTNRPFKTSTGRNITIGGGNYGYGVDKKKLSTEIVNGIKEGKNILKEPTFSQKGNGASPTDIGNTYVEISLGGQHIWFYKNGKLMTESDIVTGTVSKGWQTPPGVYKLTYKQRDAVLVGEDYRTPVKFWMPFNGGIGLHDATWRGQFGGEIYKSNGSHGCVNLPYKVAEIIYNNINDSMPIILY